jgi:hypothetical protein
VLKPLQRISTGRRGSASRHHLVVSRIHLAGGPVC